MIHELTIAINRVIVDTQEVQRIEHELALCADAKARGAFVRSRASWVEQGEKPTRFFFNLEKRKQAKSCITKLEADQSIVTKDRDILEHARNFYQKLFNF